MPYVLPILPDTIEAPLDDAGMPGAVAVLQPLDAEDLAKHFDAFPFGSHTENFGSVVLAKKHLLRVEHCLVSTGVAFDLAIPAHATALWRNRRVVQVIFAALLKRAGLGDDDEKKSDSPSVSVVPPNGGTSPAAPAATSGETSTIAASPTPSGPPPISTTPSS